MAVKLRCTKCKKVFSVPEGARGHAVRCPGCENKIRVPAGKTANAVATAVDDENFLANIDLREAEDKSVRVCPKCGAVVSEDDVDCQACGVEIATGLPGETARKRKLKGPDPDLYYRTLWRDARAFLSRNKSLAIRTATYITVSLLAALACTYMSLWCARVPPTVFWAFLAGFFFLIPQGWVWHLATEIIKGSLQKKDKLKRVHFDIFTCAALGIKVLVWLIIASVPIQIITGGLGALFYFMGYPIVGYALVGVGLLIVLVTVPIMMSHMSMPVTWPGWVSPMLLSTFASNLKPTLYWLLLAIVMQLPIVAGIVAIAVVSGNHLVAAGKTMLENKAVAAEEYAKQLEDAQKGSKTPVRAKEEDKFQKINQQALIVPGAILAAMCVTFGFTSVMTMRANGQFAYYFKRKLGLISLVKEVKYIAKGGKLQGPVASELPAGFFPRMTALIIDCLMVAAFWGVLGVAIYVVCDNFDLNMKYGYITWGVLIFLVTWLYFASQESGPDQGTFGKKTVWICVVDESGLPIGVKRATVRYFVKLLTGPIGWIFAAFTGKKQAVHDMVAKTTVKCRN